MTTTITVPPVFSTTNGTPVPPIPAELPAWALKLAWAAVDLHQTQKHAMLSVMFKDGRWRMFVSKEAQSGMVE